MKIWKYENNENKISNKNCLLLVLELKIWVSESNRI